MKIKKHVMKLRYRNFFWAVTWLITYVCNLRCKYCQVTPTRRHPDIRRALETVLRIKPKHLCISGGEPTLIPGFTELMRELRAGLPHADIVLNTNATRPDETLAALPFISTLAFSIDGVGEVNRRLRGVDGDVLLETLERIIRAQVANGNRLLIGVVPVAITENFREIGLLLERVDALHRRYRNRMFVDIKPMHPYNQPMTVAYDPDIYAEFVQLSKGWREGRTIPIRVRGVGERGPLTECGAKTAVNCFRQYFGGLVTGDGNLMTCKPEKYYDYYHDRYKGGTWREKIKAVGNAVRDLVICPYSSECCFPCEHMEFIEEPLAMGRASEVLAWTKSNNIHLEPDEAGEVFRFIRRYFNPSFVIDA